MPCPHPRGVVATWSGPVAKVSDASPSHFSCISLTLINQHVLREAHGSLSSISLDWLMKKSKMIVRETTSQQTVSCHLTLLNHLQHLVHGTNCCSHRPGMPSGRASCHSTPHTSASIHHAQLRLGHVPGHERPHNLCDAGLELLIELHRDHLLSVNLHESLHTSITSASPSRTLSLTYL